MLRTGTLKNKKAIVEQYVKRVIIYKDNIEIEYCISDTYTFTDKISR